MTVTWNGLEPHQERWVIVATAAFVLLSAVVMHQVGAYNRAHPESLFVGAKRGAMLQVTFNTGACNELVLGEVVCGGRYLARYSSKTNRWTVRGPTTIDPTAESTATFPNNHDEPGSISIWGVEGSFDDTGKLIVRGTEAATVQFATGKWAPLYDQP
jgi:hypothetical protein